MASRIDAIEAQGQILLVTGDPHIEDLLAWTLTLAKQHFVCIATDQMIHPEWLAQWSLHPPALLLLDVDVRGPGDVLSTLYARWRATSSCSVPSMIVLTTHVEKREEFEREGAIVLTKPFHPHVLINVIATKKLAA